MLWWGANYESQQEIIAIVCLELEPGKLCALLIEKHKTGSGSSRSVKRKLIANDKHLTVGYPFNFKFSPHPQSRFALMDTPVPFSKPSMAFNFRAGIENFKTAPGIAQSSRENLARWAEFFAFLSIFQKYQYLRNCYHQQIIGRTDYINNPSKQRRPAIHEMEPRTRVGRSNREGKG